jgi:diacylglycerol O-acyltransferase
MVIADLATNVRDPAKRFRAIKASMDASKAQLQQMTPGEIQVYTGITQAPLLLGQLTGLASRFPAFSTVISNVPGTRERRYWNGARLEGMYPVSIPFDGAAVNFTLVSNYENLDFGIVACRKSVPQVQRMIDYMEESLVELEDAAGLRRRSGRAKGPLQRLNATESGTTGKQKVGASRGKKAPAVPKLKAKRGGKSPAQPKRVAAAKAASSKTSKK